MTSDARNPVRWLDVVLLVAAAPFALLMGAPVLGYVVGAVAWTTSHVLAVVVERAAKATDDPKRAAGLTLFAGMGRTWLVGLAILLTGIAGAREDGLTAGLVALFAFTVNLVVGAALRPRPQRRTPSPS